MLKIGLTGGIGSGKSSVCALFQELGVNIIDADNIAKALVAPGLPALTQIIDQFGKEFLQADGTLDRAKLRKLIFSDKEKKQQLENILHPLVYKQIDIEIQHSTSPYCIIAVPLLLETQKSQLFDRILVVDCSIEEQLQRVESRDKLNRTQILSIIGSQIPREQRLKRADDIIDNSANITQLAEQIKRLHNSYLLLATVRTSSA
jgi:dephospho-CoA kinase